MIRGAAAKVSVKGNQITLNQGPGLILEKGLDAASYSENTVTKNTAPDTLTDTILTHEDDKAPDSSETPPR